MSKQHVSMEAIYPSCVGLDVHKKTVVACLKQIDSHGKVFQEIRTFGTMTKDLLALSDWMAQEKATVVAMESTGVYWKPIWNILEGQFEVLVVNAHHIKQVKGRKTDVKDCEWIAHLLQVGLLKGSFVPHRPIREMRDLTRYRAKLVGEHTSAANRIQKVLEDANIKLASVASDVLGVSGRDMLEAIIAGIEDPRQLADLSRKALRKKIPELELALEGRLTDHHRYLLKSLMKHLRFLESEINELDQHLEKVTSPFEDAVQLLDTIPGVDRCTAENLLAEMGPNMNQFPSGRHVASWSGMCPGNNESAGKRKSGKTMKGNRALRRALTEAAWAASRKKDTYTAAKYQSLVGRRGKKRALVAVGHHLLLAAYHILKKKVPYNELGPDFLLMKNGKNRTNHLVKQLEKLGHKVILEKAA